MYCRIPIIPCVMDKDCPTSYVCAARVCIMPDLICNDWCSAVYAPVCGVLCEGTRTKFKAEHWKIGKFHPKRDCEHSDFVSYLKQESTTNKVIKAEN